jgi:hypothetical protein
VNFGLRIADCGLEADSKLREHRVDNFIATETQRTRSSPAESTLHPIRNPQSEIPILIQSAIHNPQSAIPYIGSHPIRNPQSAIPCPSFPDMARVAE